MPPRRRSSATTSSTTSSASGRGGGRASRARYAKRRQRRLSRVDNDLTPSQWAHLLRAWAGCAYCRSPGPALQRDCVMPVSRGGRYTLENVVPACASCNASKHNSEVTGWLRRKKLDERTFLVRHATILRALRADE
ncbi:endonuclease [Dietzia natronolimnaea]|uniref:Endonuclease n=1 Tax=Dietzia natronolimnaea TaxID=161920 RepID=A0A2A2WSS2_9ACTN|nr:HNH endonuclease signature motif containing protein [Dietzia natronolimnaea]PAY24250.1 endonuclease [Dietzia natronolimnaea]